MKSLQMTAVAALSFAFLPQIANSATIKVPAEYPSIQAGIDAALTSDTVLVADGVYFERISFFGKAITVASNYLVDGDTTHINATVIDGDTAGNAVNPDSGSVVRFVNGEGALSALTGITLRHGIGTNYLGIRRGGGILAHGASPRITNCRVIDNDVDGVFVGPETEGIQIISCDIARNAGPGVFCRFMSMNSRIIDCEITENQGDGIYCQLQSFSALVQLYGCRIAYNNGFGLNTYRIDLVRDCVIEYNSGGIGLGEAPPLASRSKDTDQLRVGAIINTTIRDNGFGVTFLDDWITIDSCLIEGNFEYGVYIALDSKGILNNSVLRGNGNSSAVGGGVLVSRSQCFGIECINTLFDGNIGYSGGAVASGKASTQSFVNCTFVNNQSEFGSVLSESEFSNFGIQFDRCIAAFNQGGPAFYRSPSPDSTVFADSLLAQFSCTDIYGNDSGDWVGQLASQLGINGNINDDPFFCNTVAGNFGIRDISICAEGNNSCGALIGAYGVACFNQAPEITSASSVTLPKNHHARYSVATVDPDGPSLQVLFSNLPSWLVADADSVFGMPTDADVDTSMYVVATDGYLADSQQVELLIRETPYIEVVAIEGSPVADHIISNVPEISWQYRDLLGGFPQTHFEIEVGSDSNWDEAEFWDPLIFDGADTAIMYQGAQLFDGASYWLRLRVENAMMASSWYQLRFRMNTAPTAPILLSPSNGDRSPSQMPTLVVYNTTDAEQDSLRYVFEVSPDSFIAAIYTFERNEDADSVTTVLVDSTLSENMCYFWRVRASDYFENSTDSEIWKFWVNTENSPPAPFGLVEPPNGIANSVATLSPVFRWQEAFDPDPIDTTIYTLTLGLDSNFSNGTVVSGLANNMYASSGVLQWGTRYWWVVKATDLHGAVTAANEVHQFRTTTLGDADGDGLVAVSDCVLIVNYIFASGPAPRPMFAGDPDCSGMPNVSDAAHLISFIFNNGPAPCIPQPRVTPPRPGG
ncbi:MAG: right-handed parallel beta-helix repeat-containing protein [Candidatus Zixiibacteriota bacterium]